MVNALRQEKHEEVCAIRYAGIEKQMVAGSAKMEALAKGQRSIINLLISGGIALVSALIGVTAWSLNHIANILLKAVIAVQ